MVIFADRSSQLGPTLQTIRNRYGLPRSSRTGVQRRQFFCYLSCCTDTRLYTRCDAKPGNLDNDKAHLRTYEKTDFLLEAFDPGIVWDQYGLRSDVVVSHFSIYVIL